MTTLAAPGLLGEAFERHGVTSPARAYGFFEHGLGGTSDLGKDVVELLGFEAAPDELKFYVDWVLDAGPGWKQAAAKDAARAARMSGIERTSRGLSRLNVRTGLKRATETVLLDEVPVQPKRWKESRVVRRDEEDGAGARGRAEHQERDRAHDGVVGVRERRFQPVGRLGSAVVHTRTLPAAGQKTTPAWPPGAGHASSSSTSNPFWAWRRFSAWSHTSARSDSSTESVISSPRWAGRQCITSASDPERRSSLTW